MITRVQLDLTAADGQTPNMFWAYNLYADLLKKLKPAAVDCLHETGLRPLSQCFLPQKNSPRARWLVNLLTDEAAEIFLPVLLNTSEFYVEKQGCALTVQDKRVVAQTSEDELIQRCFFDEEPLARLHVGFLSPCSFKTEGSYAVFPTPALLINSAVNKWNSFARQTLIDDEQGIRQLVVSTRITGYRLQSFRYSVKGAQIPSFTGGVTLSVRGPAPMLRLFNLLLGSAEFTGIGIKCALGMGAVRIGEKEEKR